VGLSERGPSLGRSSVSQGVTGQRGRRWSSLTVTVFEKRTVW
jgi:hypothetical protein